uniref:C2H2-type domain-containing protein n=1 Tax=Cyprinus carpio TaxID=7962 RepID=A0A8C1IEQ4_CYPCA
MLHKCVVGGCPNRSDTIIHYMLPEDPKRRTEDESVEDGTCKITISEAVSLACVKEEPLEYELSANMTSGQALNSSPDESVKYEESELAVTEDGISPEISSVKENHARKCINCLTCGQRFRSRRTLMKHRRANHAKNKTESEVKEKFYICSICGERFHKMGLLLRHRVIHTKENPEGRFVCQQCGKGFPHQDAESTMPFQFRGSLIQHLKSSHAGEKLLCKTCDKGFLRVNGYVKHMDKHNVMTPLATENFTLPSKE